MVGRPLSLLALVFGIFSSACDAGTTSLPPEKGDPTDQGMDTDISADEDLGPTVVEQNGHLHVAEGQLRNEAGEAVQLKGASSMWLNWEEDGYAESLTALRWMRNNWNLKVIRAAMGVEPDNAFLAFPDVAKEQVFQVVDNAIAAGVYVIVDYHAHKAYENQDAAVAFFSEVAEKYAGSPNVIYETFNEPIEIAWPALKQYHEAVVAAIRAKDEEAVIILGTPNYSQNVDLAAQDQVAGTNLMYTLHYYACTHTAWLRQKGDAALANGIALFVTEWGATHADGGLDGIVCADEAQLWDDWMNIRKISWSAWKLDGCTDSSCLLQGGAPKDGGWTNQYLNGHGAFVRGRMQK
ncbi:MAG: glycoside hydrolase family 5 protein [Myxococcales bacterium]|nr:MAG: glycoside hydrolase family 5 protein [Myxococcales bacterium]